jgi:hypothetical protein
MRIATDHTALVPDTIASSRAWSVELISTVMNDITISITRIVISLFVMMLVG